MVKDVAPVLDCGDWVEWNDHRAKAQERQHEYGNL
jgi:hypothetical protein